MSIRVALNHKTVYRYPQSVWLSPQVIRLRPAPHTRTPILSYSLTIKPAEHFINWQQDPYSNRLARLVFPNKTKEFAVEVDLIADMTIINPFDFFLDKEAEAFPFQYDAALASELSAYLTPLPLTPKLSEMLAAVKKSTTTGTVNFLVELNARLCSFVKYLIRLEPGIQTPEQTLTLGSGSCRDSAWLLVQLLRNLGLAARFVSGYLIQLVPDVKSLDGPSGASVDFTDLHAWTEVYLPGAGWVGLDPTSGLLTGEGHIPLACSAEPQTAAAISGSYSEDNPGLAADEAHEGQGTAQPAFEFSMSVTRFHEEPRVTKPYTDAQWQSIEALGHKIDRDLSAGDVRLTMGGEPTFVSIDDMDGPEWTSAALGPMKQKRGDELLRRLRDRFAPRGLLHHGQGKWYPGESLPRWSYAIYFRKDGQPIWQNQALFADESKINFCSSEDALAFARSFATRLSIQKHFIIPGFEDAWYHLWKERRLPVNVDPLESKLENPEERARLAKIFEQGLDKTIGYCLPIRRERYIDGTGEWQSGAWFFRPERMYLLPGDSPMGFRLPLDSLPYFVKSKYPYPTPMDPMATRPPLPPAALFSQQRYLVTAPEISLTPRHEPVEQILDDRSPTARLVKAPIGFTGPRTTPALGPAYGDPSDTVRTAICFEVRGGVLRIFMPPVSYVEDYLELVSAIEDTAAELQLPVLLEGYTPPQDDRLQVIKVTPDPGVIEVNTQPVQTWSDLVHNTTVLYDEARLTRLATEKFMLDGRHTGTGGGNHIVVGGSTPSDSPLLRRPDLLKSLLAYWHNHPSLSYLFSGQFVGPTSQAPRVDEARDDQVYELELAFAEVPDGGNISPWLVDRIFRNLLIDSAGNTHRAEFCIDKLYAPESATGRLGLLELRGFEMPPHPQMSLTQQLLIRALIAKFWNQPYKQRLVRWGTQIHDRFLLPHFIWSDLDDIVFDLNQSGYEFKTEWFASHLEFRFPHYGTVQHHNVSLELRQAIEPWHVLGEEPTAGGTVRYVDSSLERMQIMTNGMIDSRHIITCNGVRVPMHPTGKNGQFVAGVRYRAWQPPGSLHPTIGVNSPLVFDVVDQWAGRSIGGCTYYVAHPGGRNYERFPINAYEAESRRVARFYSIGHTPGPMNVIEPPVKSEFGFTLDMRKV